MKKLFVLFAVIGICTLAYSQDVKVNINNQDVTAKDDCPYRINGICSTEDIGGVDFDLVKNDNGCTNIVLTNYNKCPVTVLLEYEYYHPNVWFKRTTTAVIPTDGVKEIGGGCYGTRFVGMIVRKIAQ